VTTLVGVPSETVQITTAAPESVVINAGQGAPGPPGQDAKWVSMTQAAYTALAIKDPNTLYVIVG
jgi:hypothetical protein